MWTCKSTTWMRRPSGPVPWARCWSAADDLQRRFDENLNKLTADFDLGKVSVLQEIAKAKKKPAEARAVIQIGIVIGGADGDFDKDEQAIVREACCTLDLPPHEFDL